MIWKRLLHGVGANAFNQVGIAIVQLVTVPTLSTRWGLDLYGWWILVSAIPSYIALSDLGFATAAGNEMTMALARKEFSRADGVFQSSWALISAISAFLIVVIVAVLAIVPDSYLTVTGIDATTTRTIILLLSGQSLGILQSGILLAAFRASGRYALGTAIQGMINISEGISVIVIVWAGGGALMAAVALFLVRMIGVTTQRLLLTRVETRFSWGLRKASFAEIRTLAKPAFAALSLPIAQASFLQGTNIAIGAASSTADLATFSAVRTLVRVGIQAVTLLNHATLPEFSAVVARKEREKELQLCLLTFGWCLLVLTPMGLLIGMFGPLLVSVWSQGAIHASEHLIVVMSLVMVINGLWHPFSNLLLAINKHPWFAYPYAALALTSVGVTYFAVQWCGLLGAAFSLLLLDSCMFALIFLLFIRFVAKPIELVHALTISFHSVLGR